MNLHDASVEHLYNFLMGPTSNVDPFIRQQFLNSVSLNAIYIQLSTI